MVASFATMTHSRPQTRPMPQMMDAEWTSPLYMPQAASWPISRNGEPGSSSLATRSRGSILPRAVCLSRAAWSPPCRTVAIFSRKSATSARMRSAFSRNSAERGLSRLLIRTVPAASDSALSSFLQAAPDHQALDVVRALVNLGDAHVAPQPLDREVRDVTVAAVDLDRIGAHFLGHLGGEKLRHGSFLEAGLAFVAQARGVEIELARRLDLRRHVSQAEIHRLMLDQVLAHAFSLARVADRGLECGARHAGGLGRDVDAPGFEIGKGDPVADALFAEPFGRTAVLEHDLRGVGGALTGLFLDARHFVPRR